jgi:hypothetical protein
MSESAIVGSWQLAWTNAAASRRPRPEASDKYARITTCRGPAAETRETPELGRCRRPDLLIPVIRLLAELTEDAPLLSSESERTV